MKKNDDWMESDPDWIKVKQEAEKKSPQYPFKLLLDEIEIHLRYGIPSLKLIGWIIIFLLICILYKLS